MLPHTDPDAVADAALVAVLRLLLERRATRPAPEPVLGLGPEGLVRLERAVRRSRFPDDPDVAAWRRRTIDRAWLVVESLGVPALMEEACERVAVGYGHQRRDPETGP